MLDYSKELVNELSSQARDDAVAYANMEVERAELRLKAALDSLRRFREDERALDPASSARIQLELIGTLEKQLAEYAPVSQRSRRRSMPVRRPFAT